MNQRILILAAAFIFSACASEKVQKDWVETTGIVTEVVPFGDTYSYAFEYIVDKSLAYNNDGDLIKGPVTLYITPDSTKEPIAGQEIKIRYNIHDPAFAMEFMEELKFLPTPSGTESGSSP